MKHSPGEDLLAKKHLNAVLCIQGPFVMAQGFFCEMFTQSKQKMSAADCWCLQHVYVRYLDIQPSLLK